MTNDDREQAGEAGHQGHDRQPGSHPANSASRTPPPGAANAAQVQRRSARPGDVPTEESPDMLHPGPDRLESEKSRAGEPKVEKL